MLYDHRTVSISIIAPISSHEQNDNYAMDSNTNPSSGTWHSIMRRAQKFVKRIDCLELEKRGIERISTEDRTDLTIINTAMIWGLFATLSVKRSGTLYEECSTACRWMLGEKSVSANINISCFAAGTLGPAVFNLSLYNSFATIICFNLLGIIPVAAMACCGPVSGLRTMIFSRYSWGYYGASIMATINVITAFGWTAVNIVTGAQTLRVVSNDSLPIAVSIIIIAILSMIISFVGYRWIHIYERYSWIPVLIAFCILAGVGAKYMTHSDMVSLNGTISNSSTRLTVSRIVSFGATCFGSVASWCSYSADYNTYFPEHTSQWKIFLLTYSGNLLAIVPIQILGAATYTGTYTNQHWAQAYEMNNIGGLMGASLSSLGGFGKFLLIVLALSAVASNITNIYSLALSTQAIASIFKQIPRFIYTVIGTAICILLAILAFNRFNDSLTSFMGVISYWFAIYIPVVLEDHLLFRRCSFKNYNFDIWNNSRLLPLSLAAILSGLVGIVGVALGMSQTWFSGPIAKAIAGDNHEQDGDVGFEIGFIFTAVTFPVFRLIELHFVKR